MISVLWHWKEWWQWQGVICSHTVVHIRHPVELRTNTFWVLPLVDAVVSWHPDVVIQRPQLALHLSLPLCVLLPTLSRGRDVLCDDRCLGGVVVSLCCWQTVHLRPSSCLVWVPHGTTLSAFHVSSLQVAFKCAVLFPNAYGTISCSTWHASARTSVWTPKEMSPEEVVRRSGRHHSCVLGAGKRASKRASGSGKRGLGGDGCFCPPFQFLIINRITIHSIHKFTGNPQTKHRNI